MSFQLFHSFQISSKSPMSCKITTLHPAANAPGSRFFKNIDQFISKYILVLPLKWKEIYLKLKQ